MRKKQICLIMLTVIFILTFGAQSAYAYFTANDTALGGLILSPITTDMEEDVADGKKIVYIVNYKYGTPVFVRAQGFSGEDDDLIYSSDGSWRDGGDGWWYYSEVLDPSIIPDDAEEGSFVEASPLTITIAEVKFPKGTELDRSFNVVVVYEATKALYDVDGNAYADWSNTLNSQEGGE